MTTDYHNFSYRGTPKEKRKQLNIGDIYCNAVECPECGYYLRSRNKHDMVTCKCGKTFVDGGSWYCRTTPDAILRLEYYDDAQPNSEA